MSNVLDRPRSATPRGAARAAPTASIWVRGAVAAIWAVAVGIGSLVVVSLVVWAADSGSTASAGEAMRFAVQLWLLAHRTPLRLPAGGALTIPPLALTILFGMLVARGAAIVARSAECSDARDIGLITASVAVPYTLIATVLAAITPSSSLKPSIGAAFICAVVIGGLSAFFGAARGSGLAGLTWQALPTRARASAEAGGAAALVLFTAATVLAIGSVFSHSHDFGSLVGDYRGGSGKFSMVLLSVLMIPNAIVFAVGYIAGPGFAIGSGTSVWYGGAHLGAVPAFPLLAAVPSGRAPWQVTVLFAAAMVLAGVVAGLKVARKSELTLAEQTRSAAVAAAAFGLLIAAIVAFSGGPAGPGRLSAVGPSPWQVGLAVAGEIATVSLLVVAVMHYSGKVRELVRR